MPKTLPFLLLFLAACTSLSGIPATPPQSPHPWGAALRALDAADAADPAGDITAVYLRQDGDSLQIRVDLLDFRNPKELALEIHIRDGSAPGAAPLVVRLPSQEEPAAVTVDALLDTVIVAVPLSQLPSQPLVDVATAQDEIRGLTPGGPVPAQSAPLLLAFYEAFAGRFPAEALRSWDGAHSGPRGERHGLKHLLEAVEEYQIPVVLLDLKEPENLSALDAMGALPRIRQLAEDGLLLLPETSAQKGSFDLPPSDTVYSPAGDEAGTAYRFQFTADPRHLYRWTQFPFQAVTSLPAASGNAAYEPTTDGPTLEVRRAILETALDDDPDNLLALGGSLAGTTWGSPNMVAPTLAYFAARPYIRALSEADLLRFPARAGKPALLPTPADGPARELAAHYASLTAPVLEFAEKWDGERLSGCGDDLDRDGQPECTLANEDLLAVLDPRGARLVYLFALDGGGRHQLIGPSWQVASGLSDPALWQLDLGEAADPGAYPGAFADAEDPFMPYTVSMDGDTLVFTSEDGARTKTFRMEESTLEVEYHLQGPVATLIPLLVDPWTRFTRGWASRYTSAGTPDGVRWGLEGGPAVGLQAAGPLRLRAFNESLDLLGAPEDPDFEYLPGHYVPFPLAIVEAEVAGNYRFILTFE